MSVLAEKNKMNGIWIGETLGKAAVPILSAISQKTSNLRLYSGILNIFSITPMSAAMFAATIDELSNGRFILGLGSSTPTLVALHGIDFKNPLTRSKEYIEVVRRLLAGEKLSYHGDSISLTNSRLLIKPVQKNLPIFQAALNYKMASIAGMFADGIILNMATAKYAKELISVFNKNVLASGRDPDSLDKALYLFVYISKNKNADLFKIKSHAKKAISFYASASFYDQMLKTSGFSYEIEKIHERLNLKERKLLVEEISDKMVDELTIIGDSDHVFARLNEYASSGISHLVLSPLLSNSNVNNDLLTFFNRFTDLAKFE